MKGLEVLANEKQKKVAWLNTVRVFASLTIIMTHYIGLSQFECFKNLRWSLVDVGHIGIILFFAVSGYLASNSLSRSKNVLEFYRRKLIRIVIPFAVAYTTLGIFFIFAGIFEPTLASHSPFYEVIYRDGTLWGILFSIFPMDINLIHYFDLVSYWFVGEWFIGMVVYMYLIAPILDKILRYNFFIAVILSLILSWNIFGWTLPLQDSGRITTNWWIFIVRTPEFLMGMIIFVCRDYILKHRNILTKISSTYMVLLLICVLLLTDNSVSIFSRLCVHHPISFIFSLPFIFLMFNFSEWLNEKFSASIEKFNNFSDISYMAMLIQHVIIYLFADSFELSELSTFGFWFIFVLITATIIFVSRKIHDIYKPIEEYLIKNFLVQK